MRALPLLLVMTACSSGSDRNPGGTNDAETANVAGNKAERAGFVPPAPAPLKTVSLDPSEASEAGALPTNDKQYRYLGHWATDRALCGTRTWYFLSRNFTASDGQKCKFPTVAAVPTGYELQGECQGEGGKVAQTIKLHFDEAARVMRLTGTTVGPVDLNYCGG